MLIKLQYPYILSYLNKKINNIVNSFHFQKPDFKSMFRKPVFNAEFNSQNEILNKSSLLSVSDLKGNITYVNDRFCEVSKYSMEELIGKPHSIIRHPDTSSEVFKDLWRTIGSGKVWQGEIKNRAKDGSAYWVNATISPVMGADGKPIKYISMRHDITKQKLMAEELDSMKGKVDTELFDSVNYAKYVHGTFLTPERVMHEVFPESFMIYRAQKIVSGDFHMMQHNENKSAFILGDSTGHGVSASYISIMILNILNRFLRLPSFTPSTILEDLHREICLIRNSNVTETFIESADMAFCLIDHEKLTMEYSLAKLRGVIVRDGKVIELERDKFSIGEQSNNEIKLNKYMVQIRKGDVIYLYTDGMIDQFGGLKNKKFGNKRLLSLFSECADLPMSKQEKFINSAFYRWQGSNEQTDDMSLVGVKVI